MNLWRNSKAMNLLNTIIYQEFEHHFSIVYQDIVEEMEDVRDKIS